MTPDELAALAARLEAIARCAKEDVRGCLDRQLETHSAIGKLRDEVASVRGLAEAALAAVHSDSDWLTGALNRIEALTERVEALEGASRR